jgi:hypothetical protein
MQNYFRSATLLHDIFSWTPPTFVYMRSVSRTAWKNRGTGAGLSPVGDLSQPHPNFHLHGPTAFNRARTHLPLRPLLSSHLPLPLHSSPLLPLSSFPLSRLGEAMGRRRRPSAARTQPSAHGPPPHHAPPNPWTRVSVWAKR